MARALCLIVIGATLAGAGAAAADETAHGFKVESTVALVSDYRARGLTVTDNAAAIQGGFTASHESGFSAGVWASSIDNVAGGTLEMDLTAAQTFKVNGAEVSFGGTAYLYPSSHGVDYGELNSSVTASVGPVDGTVGVAYAWDQKNIGDGDNFYVFANGVTPLAEIAGEKLALGASVGYEDGPLAVENTKLDWSLSLTLEMPVGTLGVSYVDTNLDDPVGDAAGVISLSRSF